MKRSRQRGRDDRDYDTSSLSEARGRRELSRDYSAHFFRWSFARRLIEPTHNVLEVGCGAEVPLMKVLTVGVGGARCRSYVGVDLNPLPETRNTHCRLLGGFDFVKRHAELLRPMFDVRPRWDVVVHMEVLEHMRVDLGRRLLRACRAVLKPGGRMIMSTPAYDGVYHAANHVHEWRREELERALARAGFEALEVFGTHMDLRRLKTSEPTMAGLARDKAHVLAVAAALGRYYDDDALSCILAPLFPAAARNLLWVCR